MENPPLEKLGAAGEEIASVAAAKAILAGWLHEDAKPSRSRDSSSSQNSSVSRMPSDGFARYHRSRSAISVSSAGSVRSRSRPQSK